MLHDSDSRVRARTSKTAIGRLAARLAMALVAVMALTGGTSLADVPKVGGQEQFLYAWTLGIEGIGDGSDKLVTIDARPASPTYGKVISSVSVGGRHEAHHAGISEDLKFLWASGLDDSTIYIFDIHSDPANPKLIKTITDFVTASGGVAGPHSMHEMPGGHMMISGLSNKDRGGRTALVEYTGDGEYVATYWMPVPQDMNGAKGKEAADGYGYAVAPLPRKNVMLTSSFTGLSNYMNAFESVVSDEEAMKRFGNSMVIWNLKTRTPIKVMKVPGAPLEIRWGRQPGHDYAFTTTALGSEIWLVYQDGNNEWQAKSVARIGEPGAGLLPVDMTLSVDDRFMWVNTFADGMTRLYDVSDPHHPKEIYARKIATQVNMVVQSTDGKRIYFTSSLLSKWDKQVAENEHFLRMYRWNGKDLKPAFTVDFVKEKLGRPHDMQFATVGGHH
jgi:selenium-binding protein 1